MKVKGKAEIQGKIVILKDRVIRRLSGKDVVWQYGEKGTGKFNPRVDIESFPIETVYRLFAEKCLSLRGDQLRVMPFEDAVKVINDVITAEVLTQKVTRVDTPKESINKALKAGVSKAELIKMIQEAE